MKYFTVAFALLSLVAAHEGQHDAQGNHLDAQGNIITFANGTKPPYPIPPTKIPGNSSGNQPGNSSGNQSGNSSGNQNQNKPSYPLPNPPTQNNNNNNQMPNGFVQQLMQYMEKQKQPNNPSNKPCDHPHNQQSGYKTN